jgi:hypothetical protein
MHSYVCPHALLLQTHSYTQSYALLSNKHGTKQKAQKEKKPRAKKPPASTKPPAATKRPCPKKQPTKPRKQPVRYVPESDSYGSDIGSNRGSEESGSEESGSEESEDDGLSLLQRQVIWNAAKASAAQVRQNSERSASLAGVHKRQKKVCA